MKTGHGHLSNKKSFLAIPKHLFEEEGFVIQFPFDIDKETGKHGSLTNIFSCWNGMVGSGLIFIPWAFNEAGILLGIILTLIAFAISFTTQYFVMKSAGNDNDYTETLKKTFGIRGW